MNKLELFLHNLTLEDKSMIAGSIYIVILLALTVIHYELPVMVASGFACLPNLFAEDNADNGLSEAGLQYLQEEGDNFLLEDMEELDCKELKAYETS